MAPAGHDAFYVLAPVPHLDSGTDWPAIAETYRQAIQQRLEQTVLPGLGAEIVSSRVTTPQDFHDRLLSYKGAAFGPGALLLQSAYFRPHNRSEDVQGLFMVGAGTHPGAGVPGVLMSAKALETVMHSCSIRSVVSPTMSFSGDAPHQLGELAHRARSVSRRARGLSCGQAAADVADGESQEGLRSPCGTMVAEISTSVDRQPYSPRNVVANRRTAPRWRRLETSTLRSTPAAAQPAVQGLAAHLVLGRPAA
jgi:hypothetical protein